MKLKKKFLFASAVLISTAIFTIAAVHSSESPVVTAENTETSVISESSEIPAEPIQRISAQECELSVAEHYDYSGKIITPVYQVKYHSEILQEGKDYSVSLKTMQEPGKYTLSVKLKGNYNGIISKTLTVAPETSEIEILSARANGFQISLNIPQNADGCQIQYSKSPCFAAARTRYLKNTENNITNLYTSSDNSSYYIRARSYVNINSEKIYSEWSEPVLSELKKIEVKNGITYVDGILIANKTYSLPSDYNPGVNQEALDAFDTMARDAQKDNISLWIVSGFRSYETQTYTYNSFVNQRGRENADKVSARPGHSEHQSGLAFDINTTSFAFIGTPEAKWIAENCWKYGFIIRYMEGKEEITGYSYEPWHVRYLGKEKAKEIYQSGLCLEEYYGISSNYQYHS